MKLRTKILSYTLPLILIPFVLTALAVYYFVIRANQIQIQEEKNQSLHEAVANMRKEVETARKDVALLSNVPVLADFLQNTPAPQTSTALENSARAVLELFFNQNPYYLQLSLVDAGGQEKIKFSKLPQQQELRLLNKEDFFRRTLIMKEVQTPVRESQPQKFSLIFTRSIFRENFLGMVVLVLNTEVFERSMRPLLSRDLGTFLFDDRGIVLASAFNSETEEKILEKINLAKEAADLLARPSFESDQREISDEKRSFLFSVLPSESFRVGLFAPQAGENWFLGVFQPKETTAIPPAFQMLFFSILFLAVGAVLWVTARTARRITIPLEKVSAATGKIARGDSDLNLDIKTGDEVEDLAEAVKKMNDDLQNYQKQLVQSAKLATMGEMTSEISHEIQNRISGISLWLQHLDAEISEDDPKHEYLEEMKQGLQGFLEMLADLKRFYKTPALNIKEVDLNLLIKETLPFVREQIKAKNAEIILDLSGSMPKIQGDEEKLKSVILNLLLNAVDSLKDKGRIKIETKNEAEQLVLSVKDNGRGIAEEELPRIFYPFYSTRSGGSGLGLAISSNIISAHRGKIEVTSQIGKGTEFRILLPSGISDYRLQISDHKKFEI